jgi:hypothetical protein
MKEFLIQAGDLDPDKIESVTYDETASEVILRTEDGELRYKVEEAIGTYIVTYETPRFVNHIAR